MNWSYLFKHWFGTLLIGPIVSQIMMYFTVLNPHKIVGLLEVFPLSLIFSLIFSSPTYFFYGILYYFLAKSNINSIFSKIILISFAVFGVITTTQIIRGNMMEEIALSYSISSIITGLFFKLNFKKN